MFGLRTANSGDCKPEFEDFALSIDAKGETMVDRMFAALADGRTVKRRLAKGFRPAVRRQ
jgi:hypothetical protein